MIVNTYPNCPCCRKSSSSSSSSSSSTGGHFPSSDCTCFPTSGSIHYTIVTNACSCLNGKSGVMAYQGSPDWIANDAGGCVPLDTLHVEFECDALHGLITFIVQYTGNFSNIQWNQTIPATSAFGSCHPLSITQTINPLGTGGPCGNGAPITITLTL